VTEYVWDYHNRLAQVLFKDGTGAVTKSIEYIYDVNNQRIGKKIDTSAALSTGGVVTERYVIDRNQIALVFDGSGVQKSRYLYGTQIDQVLAEKSGTQVHWFLTDHQETMKDVVDNAGAVIDHITYDSFGRIVGQTSSIDLRFAYTGREWDRETSQYYYRARYYDAAVGKFISEDPIDFDGGDTNLNRYVKNQAIILKDPTGKVPLDRGEEYRVDPIYRTPEETRIDNAAYRVQVRHGTQEWDEGKFLQWRAGLLNINEFKNQWVCGYKDVINAAAGEYNISPRLLAAVSRLEVGGKTSSLKRLTYDIRSLTGRQPVPFLNRDADETSFGNLGIQIRTAAGVLGYPTNRNLTYSEALSIRYAIEDSRYGIFIGAAYLSQLQNRYLPGRDPNT
jgi:RHS repeat-associated protein